MPRTPTSSFSPGASSKKDGALQCVEILGGNVSRTEGLLLGGLEVLLVARPAGDTGGGDVYCIHSCGQGALAKFVLLDLTGHGQERDGVARAVHALLHRFGNETQPARLLDHLNQQYNQSAFPPIYAAAISATYRPNRGELRFANAGQPRPLLWSAAGRRWDLVRPVEESDCGVPLGVRPGGCYTEETIALGAGDMLFLSSDGLPETRNGLEELLGPEGVLSFLEESTADTSQDSTLVELAAAFLRRVEQFHGGKEFRDDITLLWLRRLPTIHGPGNLRPRAAGRGREAP